MHGRGAVPDQHAQLVDIPDFAGLADEVGLRAQALARIR